MLKKLLLWESWPFKLIYFPLTFVWCYYMLRSRAVWFFTPSNPTITFGGFEGEGKREMYEQLPLHTYPATMYLQPALAFNVVKTQIVNNGFAYPFVVKPENGMMGLLFRIIENEQQLLAYHLNSPVEYIVQALCNYPVEVSIFYYRHPTSLTGKVTGFIAKNYMHVIGDGISTLQQLILQHPKANTKLAEMKAKHATNYNDKIPNGEKYYLSQAGNHNRGATFVNMNTAIDAALVSLCDSISNNTNQFYYGRFDIKCESIESLKAQKNYSILEYNGAGAEPNHIYDCGMSLWKAYGEIIMHWQALYEISAYNNLHGSPYWKFSRGWKFLQHAKRLRKTLTASDLALDSFSG